MNFNKSVIRLRILFAPPIILKFLENLRINSVGVDPRTITLEEINKIENLCKLQAQPKHALDTSELGFQGLIISTAPILSLLHMRFVLTVITITKNA